MIPMDKTEINPLKLVCESCGEPMAIEIGGVYFCGSSGCQDSIISPPPDDTPRPRKFS